MNRKDYDNKLEELKESGEIKKDFDKLDKLEEKFHAKRNKQNLESVIGKNGEVLPLESMKNQNDFDDTSNPL